MDTSRTSHRDSHGKRSTTPEVSNWPTGRQSEDRNSIRKKLLGMAVRGFDENYGFEKDRQMPQTNDDNFRQNRNNSAATLPQSHPV
ncbi:hypothetical protein PoB_000826400 [Plakobranchus ocellatus]|uniref:Uncharacterized protein n=1 Tax=Plakobranchus ocellatus TaxID=259542 RepID=A0AAV3YIB5_9GAST|nr:hypothetical protein PoB_000826400 [Plakobranchus ocellatus]